MKIFCPFHPFDPFRYHVTKDSDKPVRIACVRCDRHLGFYSPSDLREARDGARNAYQQLERLATETRVPVPHEDDRKGWDKIVSHLKDKQAEKGYKNGWVYHQLRNLNAPNSVIYRWEDSFTPENNE